MKREYNDFEIIIEPTFYIINRRAKRLRTSQRVHADFFYNGENEEFIFNSAKRWIDRQERNVSDILNIILKT